MISQSSLLVARFPFLGPLRDTPIFLLFLVVSVILLRDLAPVSDSLPARSDRFPEPNKASNSRVLRDPPLLGY